MVGIQKSNFWSWYRIKAAFSTKISYWKMCSDKIFQYQGDWGCYSDYKNGSVTEQNGLFVLGSTLFSQQGNVNEIKIPGKAISNMQSLTHSFHQSDNAIPSSFRDNHINVNPSYNEPILTHGVEGQTSRPPNTDICKQQLVKLWD